MKIEVCFEVGDTVCTHVYNGTFSWEHDNRFTTIFNDKKERESVYQSDRVICIRRKAE